MILSWLCECYLYAATVAMFALGFCTFLVSVCAVLLVWLDFAVLSCFVSLLSCFLITLNVPILVFFLVPSHLHDPTHGF